MPTSLGKHSIGYSHRGGHKVRHRDLVEDGEIPGLRVHRKEADPEHPQKHLRPIGPDQVALYRPSPEQASHSVRYVIGSRSISTNLYDGIEYVPVSYGMTTAQGAIEVDGTEVATF